MTSEWTDTHQIVRKKWNITGYAVGWLPYHMDIYAKMCQKSAKLDYMICTIISSL